MAKTSWLGLKTSKAFSFAKETRHLAARRRKISPTAMGCTPVFFFFRAVREALQKVEGNSFGKPLAKQKLIRLVSFCSAILDCSGLLQRIAFDRCSGYIMQRTDSVPMRKEDNMSLTTLSENWYSKLSSSVTPRTRFFSSGYKEQRSS